MGVRRWLRWALPLAVLQLGAPIASGMPPPVSQSETSMPSTSSSSPTSSFTNTDYPPFMVQQTAQQMVEVATFMGTFKRIFMEIAASWSKMGHLYSSIKTITHWEDLTLLIAVGWLTIPTVQMSYQKFSSKPFMESKLYHVANYASEIAQIALMVYGVDFIKAVCVGLGWDFCQMRELPHAFAQIAYMAWIVRRLSKLKKGQLRRYVSRHPDTFGRMHLANRLVDAVIYAFGAFFASNILKSQMGVAMQSILAFGGVGTLAMGLASKGIATEVLNGLLLATSDRIYPGDQVQFGNGIKGKIEKLGWTETVLRGSDEIVISVPNTDLVKQRVSNLSRVRFCQVKQELSFKISDAPQMPALIDEIKKEIRLACPALITEGRPFRVHWTDFTKGGIVLTVDCHFSLRPIGDEYWDNRMRVLQAIDTAVRNMGISYA